MKAVAYLNLIGVLALVVLCVFQWKENSRLNLRVIDLDKTRQEQLRTIDERDATIKNVNADLDDFRSRLDLAEKQLKEDEAKLLAIGKARDKALAERDIAIAQRDQVKAIAEKWEAAVKERDEAMTKQNDEITKLGKDRNDVILKYNDLAKKYDDLVKDLNEARAKLAGK